jgi:hypothetical protein
LHGVLEEEPRRSSGIEDKVRRGTITDDLKTVMDAW